MQVLAHASIRNLSLLLDSAAAVAVAVAASSAKAPGRCLMRLTCLTLPHHPLVAWRCVANAQLPTAGSCTFKSLRHNYG